jgi:hypothetical protein
MRFKIGFLLKDEINIINSDAFQRTIQWVKILFEEKEKKKIF